MSKPHFNFPPPPPPPQATYYTPPPGQTRNSYNDRYGRGGSGHRGRGRGNNRGVVRGEYAGNLGHAFGYGGYPQADQRRGQPNSYEGAGYPLPEYPQIQQPQYPPSEYNTYSQPTPQFPSSQPFPSPQYQPYPPYPTNGHPNPLPYNAQSQNQPYGHRPPSNHPSQPSSRGRSRKPVMMGPPIHIGPDGRPTEHRPLPYSAPGSRDVNRMPIGNQPPRSSGAARQDSPNPFPGRGRKRNRSEAFRPSDNFQSRPQAAPAVPSFGNPLPVDLPIKPPGTNGKKRKKKRRHNQLGLTPRAEEHESSEEEEDDQDEEAKLAAATDGQLRFTFKGQTSILQTSTDIAEWIAERKKRFPTKARAAEAEERKRRNQAEQRAARQAAKESQEKRRAEAKAKQEQHKTEASIEQEQPNDQGGGEPTNGAPDSKAAKAQAKVEKLRRRLEKEEKRIAKARAKATKTEDKPSESASLPTLTNERQELGVQKLAGNSGTTNGVKIEEDSKALPLPAETEVEAPQLEARRSIKQEPLDKDDTTLGEAFEKPMEEPSIAPNPLTPTSQPSNPDVESSIVPNRLAIDTPLVDAKPPLESLESPAETRITAVEKDSDLSTSTSLSDISTSSDEDDDISSSGESSSSDDVPDAATSIRTAPEKVPPPKRERPTSKEICRRFLRSGRCPHGEHCKFRHDLPEKGQRSRAERQAKPEGGKTERKTLHQRLVEQEKEQEDQQVLQAIVRLGERGFLTEPNQQESNENGSEPL